MASVMESSRLGGYVTQYEQINTSTSKQKYSFGISKGPRFPNIRPGVTDVVSYDLPTTKTKRTCSFGVGPRFSTPMNKRNSNRKFLNPATDKLICTDSPPPGSYNLVSDFDIGNPKKGFSITKGHLYSFGGPHSLYKKVYNPEAPQAVNIEHLPGPGQYDDKTLCIGHDGIKYKMQGRSTNMAGKFPIAIDFLTDPMNISIKKNTPAPGHYGRGIEINALGVYSLSTIKNSKAAAWSPSKKRFSQVRTNQTPGPGNYNPSDYSNGLYVLSNFKNRGTPHIIRPNRQQNSSMLVKRDGPGPGSYMPPSDFGYLELYKYSPRTSQGQRSVMEASMYSTTNKFNVSRGIS